MLQTGLEIWLGVITARDSCTDDSFCSFKYAQVRRAWNSLGDRNSQLPNSAVLSRPTKCPCIYGMRTCSHNPLLRIISMPPVQDQSQLDGDLARLTPFIECNNNSRISTCTRIVGILTPLLRNHLGTIVFVALLLVFYALALWDRWLNLKLRESQMLAGTTSSHLHLQRT